MASGIEGRDLRNVGLGCYSIGSEDFYLTKRF
jgi:hypothetical protein